MIKYTPGFVDKLEDILEESKYTVRYERGNFQSGWCLLDHKRVVVLNKFLDTEGRVNTLVDLIPQLKIDYDKLTLSSQKLYDFLSKSRLEKLGIIETQEEMASTGPESQMAEVESASSNEAQAPQTDSGTEIEAEAETETEAGNNSERETEETDDIEEADETDKKD